MLFNIMKSLNIFVSSSGFYENCIKLIGVCWYVSREFNLNAFYSSVSAYTPQRSQGSVDTNHRSSHSPSRIAIASDVNFQYPPINAHHHTCEHIGTV